MNGMQMVLVCNSGLAILRFVIRIRNLLGSGFPVLNALDSIILQRDESTTNFIIIFLSSSDYSTGQS